MLHKALHLPLKVSMSGDCAVSLDPAQGSRKPLSAIAPRGSRSKGLSCSMGCDDDGHTNGQMCINLTQNYSEAINFSNGLLG